MSILEGPDPWVDGWYTMAINLSDIAAMGGRPLGILLALEAPNDHLLSDLDRFYDGVQAAAEEFSCPVLGGNVKDAPRFSAVGVGFGVVEKASMLRRGAARPGDAVLVLGDIGRFWAGVLDLMTPAGLDPDARAGLRRALRRPTPRVREGRLLSQHNWSECAMDNSDGLVSCFYEIAGQSMGVDLHIDLKGVEVDPVVLQVATAHGIDVRKLLLSWGDWQLVCTARPELVETITAAMTAIGCPVSTVGWVSDGDGRVWLHDDQGTGRLNYVASERFTPRSYFSHGIEQYVDILRREPLSTLGD
jgi:thiamine-monophosphate kinase